MTRLARLLLLIAGGTVLVALAWGIGAAAVLGMLQRVGWAFLWVSALYSAHVALRALALWRSLAPNPLRYHDVLRVRLSGEAIEVLTFTGPFLAEPSKGWLLKKHGIGTADAFGAVAVEYLLYTAVAFWMAGGALSVLLVRGVLGHAFQRPIVAILVAVAAFTVGLVYAAASGTGLVAPTLRGVGRALGRAARAADLAARIEPIERVLVGFMHDRPVRLFEVLGIEVAGHALLVAETWIVLRAVGASLSPADPVVLEGGIKLVGAAFFFIPGQLGAAEGVYVLLASALGFGSAAGLTLALVRRVRALIVAAGGVAVLAAFPPSAPPRPSKPMSS